jgi:hypothetical protein
MNLKDATSLLSILTFMAFGPMAVLTTLSMLRRMLLYVRANKPIPILLRRGIVLFSAFSIVVGESVILRATGIMLAEGSLERFLFILQADILILIAMGYYAKAELFDIDNPDQP